MGVERGTWTRAFVAGWLVLWPRPDASAGEADRPPVIRLSFDEDVHDSGPHRLRGTAHGDGVSRIPGLLGQALFVGGTEDWLDLALDDGRLSLAQGATLELWLRREDWTNPYRGGSGWQTVASIGTALSLSITAPGCPLHEPWALQGSVHGSREDVGESESASVLSAPGSVRPHAWTHAALVYDAAPATLALYVDGKGVDLARGVPAPDPPRWHIRLGTWHEANQAYRGLIDELAFYDHPRSAETIARAARALR